MEIHVKGMMLFLEAQHERQRDTRVTGPGGEEYPKVAFGPTRFVLFRKSGPLPVSGAEAFRFKCSVTVLLTRCSQAVRGLTAIAWRRWLDLLGS